MLPDGFLYLHKYYPNGLEATHKICNYEFKKISNTDKALIKRQL